MPAAAISLQVLISFNRCKIQAALHNCQRFIDKWQMLFADAALTLYFTARQKPIVCKTQLLCGQGYSLLMYSAVL